MGFVVATTLTATLGAAPATPTPLPNDWSAKPARPAVTTAAPSAIHVVTQYIWSVGGPQGTPPAGRSVQLTVTATDGTTPVADATIYLSLTSTASRGGFAIVAGGGNAVAMTGTPAPFLSDSVGAVLIRYTAPTPLPASGVDILSAKNQLIPAVSAMTTYAFAEKLSVSAPSSATVGLPIIVTVTAKGETGNTDIGYAGSVQLTSTDASATLPASYTFNGADAGVHAFSVTLRTSGDQTVTATDTQTNVGVSNSITVSAPPPFHPQDVGAPSTTVLPNGSQQLVFWRDSANHLVEAWYAGGNWNGPLDLSAAFFGGAAPLASAPSATVTADGSTQIVFWKGPGGHLFEAWYTLGGWHGPIDVIGGAATLSSAPSAAVTPDGSTQLVFWQGGNHLLEAWYALGSWHGPVDWTAAAFGGAAPLTSSPSVHVTPDGSTQLVFWQGAGGHLMEGWFTLGGWHGPADWTASAFGGAGLLTSAPSAAVTMDGSTQIVFWQGAGGHLMEGWYTLGSWHGPVDWTASFGGAGPLTSAPSAAVTPDGSTQLVFWQGADSTLWQAWYANGWNGPVDWSPAPPPTSFLFNIAPVQQDMPLDCEAAALEEATRAKGRDVSQDTFFKDLAKQTSRATWSGRNIARWGNPYVSFVGDVFGSESAGTGYGVYSRPIASVAISEGFNSVNIESGDVGQVQSLVLRGDPVIIWTSNTFSPVAMRTWVAWDGTAVPYALTEHAVTVVGVDVRAGTITVNDVADGRMKTFTTSQFAAFWRSFGNMAVALE